MKIKNWSSLVVRPLLNAPDVLAAAPEDPHRPLHALYNIWIYFDFPKAAVRTISKVAVRHLLDLAWCCALFLILRCAATSSSNINCLLICDLALCDLCSINFGTVLVCWIYFMCWRFLKQELWQALCCASTLLLLCYKLSKAAGNIKEHPAALYPTLMYQPPKMHHPPSLPVRTSQVLFYLYFKLGSLRF